MAGLAIGTVTRTFQYNGLQLNDPGEVLTPEQVRDLYSATYPELLSAAVDGPKMEGGSMIFEFVRAVRDKG